jgi:hypothetical protein
MEAPKRSSEKNGASNRTAYARVQGFARTVIRGDIAKNGQ